MQNKHFHYSHPFLFLFHFVSVIQIDENYVEKLVRSPSVLLSRIIMLDRGVAQLQRDVLHMKIHKRSVKTASFLPEVKVAVVWYFLCTQSFLLDFPLLRIKVVQVCITMKGVRAP